MKCRNPEKLRNVYIDIIRELDKMENDLQPDTKLSATVCSYPNVIYDVPRVASVVLENIGQVCPV